MYNNLSAMNAFADGMAVSAHNIANISTSNFNSYEYNYIAGYGDSVGLQVDPTTSLIVNPVHLAPFPSAPDLPPHEALGIINNNVDLSREFSKQIYTEHAFEANAIAISTRDEMERSLYNQVNGPSLIAYRV